VSRRERKERKELNARKLKLRDLSPIDQVWNSGNSFTFFVLSAFFAAEPGGRQNDQTVHDPTTHDTLGKSRELKAES
jgi:hypothetical protein